MKFRSKLVSYYTLKVFFIINNKLYFLNKLPLKVKQLIHAIVNNPTYYSMMCKVDTLYIVNTLKKIHVNYNLFCALSTELYNKIRYILECIFSIFIKPSSNNIDSPAVLEERNSNFDKAAYF